MANIDDNIIQQLNVDIEKIADLYKKKRTERGNLDQILIRSTKSNISELIKDIFSSIGVQGGEKYVKFKNLDVNIGIISEILQKETIKFEFNDNKLIVKYTEDDNMVIIFEFQIINDWISSKSYLLNKKVKEEKEQEALKLLNQYNFSTRHTKACILEDKSILLLRNDYANFIWDEEDLRDIIIADIVIMLDFYKSQKESLADILNE